MKTYQTVIKDQLKENGEAIREIERTKSLWPMMIKLQKEIQFSSIWCDYDGINSYVNSMTKRETLCFLDDFFWSQGIETTDPDFYNGRIRVKYECPNPVFGNGKRPVIALNFELKVDDTCRKVFVGIKKVEQYEWVCD